MPARGIGGGVPELEIGSASCRGIAHREQRAGCDILIVARGEIGCRRHWRMVERRVDEEALPITPQLTVSRSYPKQVRTRTALERSLRQLSSRHVDSLASPLCRAVHHPMPARGIGGGVPEL